MSQDALGQLKHLKTARARWPFPDVFGEEVVRTCLPFPKLRLNLDFIIAQGGMLGLRSWMHSNGLKYRANGTLLMPQVQGLLAMEPQFLFDVNLNPNMFSKHPWAEDREDNVHGL